MTTLVEWERREDLRLGLAELLANSEPLRKALEVCLSKEVDSTLGRTAGDSLLESAALAGARREGYFQFRRALLALAIAPTPREELPTPWAGKKSVQGK